MRRKSSGIDACEEALGRLVNGSPAVPEHVGVDLTSITCAMVSVEAGFDKGYLKRGRDSHKALIARIDALKAAAEHRGLSIKEKVRKAEKKAETFKEKYERANQMLGIMMTENLRLLERIRELEASSHLVQRSIL